MMSVRVAQPGNYLDCDTTVTAAVCAAVKSAGYLGIGRYLPFHGLAPTPANGCISAAELAVITSSGLDAFFVMHVRGTQATNFHWHPSACNGADDANDACDCAIAAGVPSGVHIFLDLEAISDGAVATIEYANDVHRQIAARGFKPATYVGFDVPLSPEQLYELTGDCYWTASGATVATRGAAIVQGSGVVIAGVSFDRDIVATDKLGGLPLMCGAGPADVA
jgi:hypothetical protein